MIKNSKLLLLVLFAGLTSCATADLEESRTRRLEDTARAEHLVKRAKNPTMQPTVEVTDLYLGPLKPVERAPVVDLPPIFNEKVVISSPNPLSVGEVLALLTDEYGIRTRVEESAIGMMGSIDSNPKPLDGGMLGGQSMGGSAEGGGQASMGVSTQYKVPLEFKGTVKGLLDLMASRMNVSWEWRDQRVFIFYTKTRAFPVDMLPGAMSYASDVANSATAGSEPTGGETNVAYSGGTSLWQSVAGELSSFLTSSGTVNISEATGTVVVTDTPTVLSRIEGYIKDLNRRLSQQALFKVEVYEVTQDRDQQIGIDWNAVYAEVDDFGLSLLTNAVDSDLPGSLTGQVIDANSRYNGSEMIVRALHEQGDVSLVQTISVVAANYQPVPVRAIREITYLSSSSTTTSVDVGATSALEADVVTEGFTITLLPMISGQEILLQASLELSKVEDIVRVEAAGSAIETPRRRVKNFLQRAHMRSGNVLVLSGLEQDENGEGYRGVGPEIMGVLGGQKSRSKRKSTTVVLITPYVMDRTVQWGTHDR